jgi:hypothetical protein
MPSSYGTPCTWRKSWHSSHGRGLQSTKAISPISGPPGMRISMSLVAITSTSRRHKSGRDYDHCVGRAAQFLHCQNFSITIGKPGASARGTGAAEPWGAGTAQRGRTRDGRVAPGRAGTQGGRLCPGRGRRTRTRGGVAAGAGPWGRDGLVRRYYLGITTGGTSLYRMQEVLHRVIPLNSPGCARCRGIIRTAWHT